MHVFTGVGLACRATLASELFVKVVDCQAHCRLIHLQTARSSLYQMFVIWGQDRGILLTVSPNSTNYRPLSY
jgi:hypothetical protein